MAIVTYFAVVHMYIVQYILIFYKHFDLRLYNVDLNSFWMVIVVWWCDMMAPKIRCETVTPGEAMYTYQRQNRCWQWRHLLKKMEELGREIIILQGRSFGVGVQYWLFISCLNVDKSWWMHFNSLRKCGVKLMTTFQNSHQSITV